MTLKNYLAQSKNETTETFAKKAKVSVVLVRNVANGLRVARYPIAKAISLATGGKVSIADLCE